MENIPSKSTGDTYTASEFNNNARGELLNAVTNTGQALSAGDTNQLSKAIATYAVAGDFYAASGTNTIVLSRPTGTPNLKSPEAYKDGFEVTFKSAGANTGAVTLNVDSLGAKNLTQIDGTALSGGEISASSIIVARYNLASDRFELRISQTSAIRTGATTTIEIEDEGSSEGPADTIDFVGDGVTASVVAGKATVTIPGSSSGGDYGAKMAAFIFETALSSTKYFNTYDVAVDGSSITVTPPSTPGEQGVILVTAPGDSANIAPTASTNHPSTRAIAIKRAPGGGLTSNSAMVVSGAPNTFLPAGTERDVRIPEPGNSGVQYWTVEDAGFTAGYDASPATTFRINQGTAGGTAKLDYAILDVATGKYWNGSAWTDY